MNNILKRSFCVPYNGDIELVKIIANNYKNYVYEFYGTDNLFTSGRSVLYCQSAPIKQVMDVLKGTRIKFNYLLNSIVLDDYIININKLKRHLEFLREIGVDTVTASSPYFVDFLKKNGFEVSTSLMQHIRNEASIKYHEKLGYNRIIISEDEMRNVPLLKRLTKCTKLKLEIIINNCCLKECPFRMTHYNSEGIRRSLFLEKYREHLNSYCRQCKEYWYLEPKLFMGTSWIRPEELSKYKKIGIHLFKLAGRSIPSFAVLDMLRIYSQGKWHGSIWDYLKPFADPVDLYGIQHIKNRELDEFFDYFFTKGCDGGCSKCSHCEKWAKKMVRTVANHQVKLLFPKGANGIC